MGFSLMVQYSVCINGRSAVSTWLDMNVLDSEEELVNERYRSN